jgi:hypothetical protein
MRRPRGKILVLALAIALAAGAGCGGDEEEAPGESVQALVEDAGTASAQATVEKFFDAGNDRDAATICNLVTSDQAEAFGQAAGGDCVDGMRALFEAKDPPRTEVIIEDVRVLGDRATVDATITQGGETRPTSLSLIQEGGDWKLADPGI